MSLKLTEYQVVGATVLALEGTMTIGAGDCVFRDAVRRVVDSGVDRLVLDWSQLRYVDSAGWGEIVSAHTTAKRRNVRFAIAGPSRTQLNHMHMTRLVGVLIVADTVEAALAELATPRNHRVRCPIDGCNGWSPWMPHDAANYRCVTCSATFEAHRNTATATADSAAVAWIKVTTYERESVHATFWADLPVLRLSGRLDLFSADLLERAWRSLPAPRHVLFDLSGATEASQPGVDIVSRLCAQTPDTSGVVLLGAQRAPESPVVAIEGLLAGAVQICRGHDEAAAVLRPRRAAYSPLLVQVEQQPAETAQP
jgi:anti-anti-sigma factor